jgi:hypothetical protein
VDALASAPDLFELFGEIAGVDVHAVVPASHALDSEPMLAYLQNGSQPDLRTYVFTQLGDGLKPPSPPADPIPPCVLEITPGTQICTDILLTTADLCSAAGGTPETSYASCCAYKDATGNDNLTVVPKRAWAIRNDEYKLVQVDRPECDANQNPYELYKITPQPLHPLNPLGIDNAVDNLLPHEGVLPVPPLTPRRRQTSSS